MIRALRSLVLVLSVAAFQLTLAGGGAECVGSSHGMASTAMSGSDIGSQASAPGMADMAGSGSSSTPCSQTGTQSCRAMTACTSAVRVATDVPADPAPVPSAALSLIVLVPSSLALAPDLPPPRA